MMDYTATSKYDYKDEGTKITYTYAPHLMRLYTRTNNTSGIVKLRIAPREIPEPKPEVETFDA
jgi:hypothetical protein